MEPDIPPDKEIQPDKAAVLENGLSKVENIATLTR